MTKIDKDFDIIIVGQGLVGACFALDIARKSPALKIALLDDTELIMPTNANINCGSRVYAISPNNIQYLKALEVLPNSDKVNDIEQMLIFDANTKESLELNCNSIPTSYLAKMVDSDTLLFNLQQKLLWQSNISWLKTKLISFHSAHSNNLNLITDIGSYNTKLLVGSDGANSLVRALSGFKTKRVEYNSVAIIANFSTQYPHLNRAFQFFTAMGILAYLPLPNGHISIVLSTSNKDIINLEEHEFTQLIQDLAQQQLGTLQLLTKPKAFPLAMNYLKQIYHDKIVLIGDAAHSIHPLAGMGVNLGFSDAQCLADLLAKVASLSIADINILAKYNAIRNFQIKRAIKLCDLIERVFNSNDIITRSTRKFGMKFLNQSKLLKRLLISHVIHG